MTEQNAVPLIVLSTTRDPVEQVNSLLRRAGLAVHCTWIPALRDLGDALGQLNPELLVQVNPSPDDLLAAAGIREQLAPAVPLLAVLDTVDEEHIAEAMQLGARDVVSLGHPARLQAVVSRELHAFRLERALNATVKSAHDARSQLASVLQRSNDAIVQVQEGIVIEANPAWLELFGHSDLAGQPVMDLFDEATQPALRGALAACVQGRWSDHALRATALLADGSPLALDIVLALGEHDGEPAVSLVVPSKPRDDQRLVQELEQVVRSDATTGMLHRRELIQALRERLGRPAPGGKRAIALVKLDRFANIEREIGIFESEEVLKEFARVLRDTLNDQEVVGRFGGVRFLALLERGNDNDVGAWASQLHARLQKQPLRLGERSVSLTCTIGLALVPPGECKLDTVICDAIESCRKGSSRDGNQTVMSASAEAERRAQAYDQVWVKHIKSALMENRFRLVQQPIASLTGDDPGMFDVLVRMVDPNGKEVLPSEFMAAAERNDLLKNIDRWVVGASLSFAAQREPGCLFVRLSRDSVRDGSFVDWLDNHLRSARAEASRLCFQVTEEVASNYGVQVKSLAAALRQRKFRFALEAFGSGRNSQGTLEAVPADFIKIDGAVVQGLTGDAQLQGRVRLLVEAAKKRDVQTIAERVENANTMAVLWQLGVQFIQGYFVNQPEQVVLRGER